LASFLINVFLLYSIQYTGKTLSIANLTTKLTFPGFLSSLHKRISAVPWIIIIYTD